MALEELGVVFAVNYTGNAVEGFDATTASAGGLTEALAQLASLVDGLSGSMDALAGSVDGVAADMAANTAAVEANTAAMAENAGAVGAAGAGAMGLTRAARMLLMPLGLAAAAVIGIGVAAVNAQSQYESAMSVVQALTGQTAQTMVYLNAQVLQTAQQLGTAPTALAQGLYFILSAGVHSASQAMAELKVVTMASAASFVDAQSDAIALTKTMNAYGAGANQAMYYQDILLQGVTQGESTMQEFGRAMALTAASASRAGYGVNQTAAALATLTLVFGTGRRAGNDLSFLMRDLGITTDKVAKSAQSMGLSFDEAKFKTMDLYHQLQYLQTITKGNQAELLKLTGGQTGWLAYSILMTKGGKNFQYILEKMKEASGKLQSAWLIHTQTIGYQFDKLKTNITLALTKIGAAIEPVAIAIMKKLDPALTAISTWASSHGRLVVAIFVTLGAALLAAFGAVIGMMVATMGTIGVVVLAIVGGAILISAAAGFIISNWKKLTEALQPVMALLRLIGGFLAPLGQALRAQLAPVLAQLGQTIKTSLLPAWKNFQLVLVELKPLLIAIAVVVGVVLVVAIALIIGILLGVIKAFGAFLTAVIKVMGGIVLAISGAWELISSIIGGILAILGDMIHGNWSHIGADATTMWNGIKTGVVSIVKGLWQAISGIFQGAIGIVWGLVSGLVSGVIGFFQHLFDTLVGHSIIPDMVNKIIDTFKLMALRVEDTIIWFVATLIATFLTVERMVLAGINAFVATLIAYFMTLASRVLNVLGGLRNAMLSLFSQLATSLFHAGVTLITNLIAGIQSMLPNVKAVVGAIAAGISGAFPHSPAKWGPLVGWENTGGHMMTMLANSMNGAQSTLAHAAGNAAGVIATGVTGGSALGGSASNAYLQKIVQQLSSLGRTGLGPGGGAGVASGVPNSTVNNWGGVSLNGVGNITQLFQQLNVLQGLASEMGARGMASGALM
jgi:TP901 family phage tail tape measure protein